MQELFEQFQSSFIQYKHGNGSMTLMRFYQWTRALPRIAQDLQETQVK